jgi:N-carbamoyl-L-amino-acid hydrolase
MTSTLQIDPSDPAGQLITNLRQLAELSSDEGGAQRVAWTDTWAAAREWYLGLLAELPVEVERDEAGNIWATLPGARPEALIIGSHLDSVPGGGWLDGCLGVLAGLEVIRGLAAAGTPPLTVKLVDWADEEGARFGLSLIGSSAAAERIDPEFLRTLVDADGITAPEALEAHGVDIASMPRAAARLRDAIAYLELHIEQGPVLEALGLPLAAVTGTYGVERWSVHFEGQSAHAGSTPMDRRRDALLSASRLALEARELAVELGGLSTVGRIDSAPGIATALSGLAVAMIDQRHTDGQALDDLHDGTRAAATRIAEADGVTVSWNPIFRMRPLAFDASLVERAARIVAELQGDEARIPSGPLHDAVHIAGTGLPTVMLFVRSKRGLSHTREEDTDVADLALGLAALQRLADSVLAARGQH